MKIKQQRQINAFLVNLFGNSRGDMLFRQQEELLDTLIRNTENKTKDQMKTLTQTILPRIALYKVLNQSGLSQEDVYRHMRNYMAGYRWNRKAFVHGKNGTGVRDFIFFTAIFSFVLCEERICGTVSRPMERIILM